MPYPLPLTRTEAYLAYKAGVVQQSDLKPSLAVPRNGIDAWLAYWTGLSLSYPVKNVGKNILSSEWESGTYNSSTGAKQGDTNAYRTSEKVLVQPDTTYIVSRNSVGVAMNFFEYDANGDFIAYTYKAIGSPITTSHTTKFITMSRSQSGGIDKMMLEEGETVSQYAPYTGEPLILQEEEAYIAYLCGVTNTYPEKCLRRVGAYLRYLISARWGRPDHPLNREELYLSLIKTQVIPSGDPSSDIVIDGTAKAPFQDVKLYGDTFQQSYTGKNLFPSSVTWTQNRAFPTANQGAWADWGGYYGFLDYIEVEPDTTYTFSNAERLGFAYGLQYYDSDKNWIDGINVATTFTTPSNCHYIRGAVASSSAPTQCQLELGASETSYEPFVGGQPSPNPDYPQIIQTVTGLQEIEVQGKNLLKLNDGATTLGGVPITTTNGTVNLKGTATSGGQGYYVTINMTASEPMVFSPNKSGTTSGLDIKLQYKRGGTVYYPSVGNYLSLQAGDIIQQMYLIVSNGAVLDGSFSPMLEKGSTKTSFEPYSKQTYEIDLNCNIYDKSQSYKDAYDIRIPIAINPGSKYAFSAPTSWVGAYLYDSSGNLTRTIGHTQSTRSGEFTAGSNEVKAIFTFYAGSEVTWSWSDIKFYDVAGVIELCKLGTYQDYIWKDGDSWKVHKATGSDLASNREWIWATVPPNGWYYTETLYGYYETNVVNAISEKIIGVPRYDAPSISSTFITMSYDGNIGIRNKDITGSANVSQFTDWLDSLNITWRYALATPTDTTITNQSLIAQLEALVAGGAENGTTYIKVDATDPNLPAKLYVEAPKYE